MSNTVLNPSILEFTWYAIHPTKTHCLLISSWYRRPIFGYCIHVISPMFSSVDILSIWPWPWPVLNGSVREQERIRRSKHGLGWTYQIQGQVLLQCKNPSDLGVTGSHNITRTYYLNIFLVDIGLDDFQVIIEIKWAMYPLVELPYQRPSQHTHVCHRLMTAENIPQHAFHKMGFMETAFHESLTDTAPHGSPFPKAREYTYSCIYRFGSLIAQGKMITLAYFVSILGLPRDPMCSRSWVQETGARFDLATHRYMHLCFVSAQGSRWIQCQCGAGPTIYRYM